MSASPSRRVLLTFDVTLPRLAVVGCTLAGLIALTAFLAIELADTGPPTGSVGTPSTAFALAGATQTIAIDGREVRATLVNTWNPANPNFVVRVDSSSATDQSPEAWTLLLANGTQLAFLSSPDQPGAYHLWLAQGLPAGATPRALRYAPTGSPYPVDFVMP